jgi:hypothetical protein
METRRLLGRFHAALDRALAPVLLIVAAVEDLVVGAAHRLACLPRGCLVACLLHYMGLPAHSKVCSCMHLSMLGGGRISVFFALLSVAR